MHFLLIEESPNRWHWNLISGDTVVARSISPSATRDALLSVLDDLKEALLQVKAPTSMAEVDEFGHDSKHSSTRETIWYNP